VLASLAACGRAEGRPYDCACAFLTDFDDASQARVEACARSSEDAVVVAKSCAQSGAPAPVEGCRCAPAEGGACSLGDCSVR